MSDQTPKQSPALAPDTIATEPTNQDTPWSIRLCKQMVDAFGEGNTDRAQVLARLLLLQDNMLFRVYAYLILSYGIDDGHSHAQKAVEEAEIALQTIEDDGGQVAKLLALAKRTLILIESQEF